MNDTNSLAALADRAYRIRLNALRMAEVQGQGYIAQALGIAQGGTARTFTGQPQRHGDANFEFTRAMVAAQAVGPVRDFQCRRLRRPCLGGCLLGAGGVTSRLQRHHLRLA